jgi:L-2-hydroxyglutarate oxidase LhgO
METSSRNSEVIHAGIYYPAGSLKAEMCVSGRQQLYRFCEEYGVEHRRCGKLIVATGPEQVPTLDTILAHAKANGAADMRPLTAAEAIGLEPDLRCSAALLSPSTGIVDSHGLMLALLGDAEGHGVSMAVKSPFVAGEVTADGIILRVGGDEPTEILARTVVNSAGLSAQKVANAIKGFPAALVPASYIAKGSYFALAARAPFSRLVYPVPEPGGLGVHLTLDLAGQARFGPDVEWVDDIDYAVDPRRCESFYGAVRKYWPALPSDSLQPAYAGMRPKISGPGAPAADFLLQGPQDHGVAGLVNLFGIESPGLTSCLAIADRVATLLDR